jgi:hypothetical protein
MSVCFPEPKVGDGVVAAWILDGLVVGGLDHPIVQDVRERSAMSKRYFFI